MTPFWTDSPSVSAILGCRKRDPSIRTKEGRILTLKVTTVGALGGQNGVQFWDVSIWEKILHFASIFGQIFGMPFLTPFWTNSPSVCDILGCRKRDPSIRTKEDHKVTPKIDTTEAQIDQKRVHFWDVPIWKKILHFASIFG